jgi:hypothetical protein
MGFFPRLVSTKKIGQFQGLCENLPEGNIYTHVSSFLKDPTFSVLLLPRNAFTMPEQQRDGIPDIKEM